MVRRGDCGGCLWWHLVQVCPGGKCGHLDQPVGSSARRLDQSMGSPSWSLDQPVGPRSRPLDQSMVSDPTGPASVSEEYNQCLGILPSALAEGQGERAFVAVVRSREELCRWLRDPAPGLQWLQVEGLLGDSDAWIEAAHGDSGVPLDVVVSDPASEFSDLYRLVDACAVRSIRVTIRAAPGFLKAAKLAAALRLPIRLLPGQPTTEMLAELDELLEVYLHAPMVEAPVEFFHSLLATMSGAETGSLWGILEEDPAEFRSYDAEGRAMLPRSGVFVAGESSFGGFVENHLKSLIDQGAECATCPWQRPCSGYFKWPDPTYSCEGVKRLFSSVKAAADEIGRDLASRVATKTSAPNLTGKDTP
jgi:hypothetical protein